MKSSDAEGDLSRRKAAHIEICTEPGYELETGSSWFDKISFRHRSLPEASYDDLDVATNFLGKEVRLPLFISSMTGGSDEGYRLNKELARAAQEAKIPVGMGSIRILFRKPELLEHFRLRPLAPDVPIWANIGAQQLIEEKNRDGFRTLAEWTRRLEVDAIAVHLNPGQELFQEGGDRDFRGVRSALSSFLKEAPLPVIVKETGFGIGPDEARSLWKAGAAYIDVAGSGGTNWLTVEAYRSPAWEQETARGFADWGWPTALVTAFLGRKRDVPLLTSGGLRSGVDLAKGLALGAKLGGMALPFIRAAHENGRDGVLETIEEVEKGLRTAMLMAGACDLETLRRVNLDLTPEFEHRLRRLKRSRRSFL